MNLLQFRQFFRQTSGRFDLVRSDGSDTGLNVFANAGQRYLDMQAELPSGYGRVFRNVVQGEYMATFRNCRSIEEVWIIGPNVEGELVRQELIKKSLHDLRSGSKVWGRWWGRFSKAPSQITQGRPLFYAPAKLRLIPNVDGEEGGVGAFEEVLADGYQYFNGIVMMPPSDQGYSVEVVGRFYSQTLVDDTDSTYWTEQFPNLLYAATMRELEIVHRNSEGVKDWEYAIQSQIVSLDMDGVNEESTDVTVMEG